MAKEDTKQDLKNCVSEFIGTFILVLTVGCNVRTGSDPWKVLSIAASLMVSIFALGSVSGANFNPAVSLALCLNGTLPLSKMFMYMGVQIVAGICAGLTYSMFFGSFNLSPGDKTADSTFEWYQAGMIELLYTFMLCFVVLRAAVADVNENANEYFPIAIGFVVVAGGYAGGWISGGCFNPAVAVGIDVSSAQFGVKWCLWYTLFELAGAALATGMHMLVDSEKLKPPTLVKKAISEFIGTFYLVFTVFLCVLSLQPAGGLAISASLMVMIYALGSVSGANFNPAVTLALLITNKGGMSASLAPVYMAAQLLGGFVAGATALFCCGGSKEIASLVPGSSNLTKALIGETAFTFVLCFVVLNVACTTAKAPIMDGGAAKQIYGWVIGFCIMVGAGAVGGVSGAALNPAVAIPLDAMSKEFTMNSLGYTAVEFLAAGIAGGLMMAVRPDEFEKKD